MSLALAFFLCIAGALFFAVLLYPLILRVAILIANKHQ